MRVKIVGFGAGALGNGAGQLVLGRSVGPEDLLLNSRLGKQLLQTGRITPIRRPTLNLELSEHSTDERVPQRLTHRPLTQRLGDALPTLNMRGHHSLSLTGEVIAKGTFRNIRSRSNVLHGHTVPTTLNRKPNSRMTQSKPRLPLLALPKPTFPTHTTTVPKLAKLANFPLRNV